MLSWIKNFKKNLKFLKLLYNFNFFIFFSKIKKLIIVVKLYMIKFIILNKIKF